MKRVSGVACVVAVVVLPLSAAAEDGVFTLESALERARERATAIVSARWRVEEARARLEGARALRDNPVLEGAVGLRSAEGAPNDLDFGLSQTFALGGRRGGRIRGAEAALERETAASEHVRALALQAVAQAFFRGLAAGERLRLAATAETHWESVRRVAERRHAMGDVALLDVNLAASALARARSEGRAAAATEVLARSDVRVLLGLEPGSPLRLAGTLEPRPAPELAALLEAATKRGDVQSAEAELREAQEEIAVGEGLKWPELTPRVRYERDAGRNVLWGGLSVEPALLEPRPGGSGAWRRRGLRGCGPSSRPGDAPCGSRWKARTRHSACGSRRWTRFARRRRCWQENETLARRSYDVGQIGLAELLLVQRETVEARLLHLERRLLAAEGEVELLARAGVLR